MKGADRRLATTIVAVCILGLAVAGYLTWVKLTGGEAQCIIGGGCDAVQKSKYAEVLGLPMPYVGLVGWLAILASLRLPGELGRAATALLAVFGLVFSLYLEYRMIFTIKQICPWCVANGGLMAVTAVLSVWRLLIWAPPASGPPDDEVVVDPS